MSAAKSIQGNAPTRTGRIGSILPGLSPAAFYLLLYVYLAREVDLRLLYNGGGLIDNFPTFYLDWGFLKGQLALPAGLVKYLCAFLAQSFYYSWAGAAVVTGQAWLLGLGTDAYLRQIGAPRLRILRFVGPLVLLAMYSQYVFYFTQTMAFTLAVLAACLFLRFAPQGAVRRGLCFGVLSLALYTALGAPSLLFAFLCAGAVGANDYSPVRQRYREALWYGLSAAVVPYLVGVLAWGLPALEAYVELLPISLGTRANEPSELMLKALWVLYLFLPVTVGAVGLWNLTFGRRRPSPQRVPPPADGPWTKRAAPKGRNFQVQNPKSQTNPNDQKGRKFQTRPAGVLAMIVLAVATAATLYVYHDPGLKALFAVDYYSREGLWSQVLDTARRCGPHYLICHDVNRALYHTGRLGDQMFSYYQDPQALLLSGKEALWQKADTCTELGLLNEAEGALSNSLGMFGEKPLLLQRLARIYLAKGEVETAGVYLRALSKVPFWRRQAVAVLTQLQNDPNLTRMEEIQHLRAVRLKQDFVRPADVLRILLGENPQNRMAYEYSMAWFLLTKDLAGFARMFNTYHNAVETRIPRHYEEAILLCQATNRGTVELGGRSVSQESVNRFESFTRALEPFGRNLAAARQALGRSFGDTYYYYFVFRDLGAR